jgi:hypothetical protein
MSDVLSDNGWHICSSIDASDWLATCVLGEVVEFAEGQIDRPLWQFWIWDVRRIGAWLESKLEMQRCRSGAFEPVTLRLDFSRTSIAIDDGVSFGSMYPWRVEVWCDDTEMMRIRIVEAVR